MALGVEHVDLGTAVTAALRSAIVSGEIATGERLVETELAEQFGVSRGPVRDALAELQRTGLVELRARKGSFVRTLTAADVDEVYTLRIALESLAIQRAVANDPDPERLTAVVDQLIDAHNAGDDARIAVADIALHRAVVQAADHGRLLDAWERLADQSLLMMTKLSSLDPDIQGPTGSHRDIVEYIIDGNASAAIASLVEHLESARVIVGARFSS